MKRVLFEQADDTIYLESINEGKSIFAKRDGLLVGMVIKETEGWILRVGGPAGCCGYSATRKECIRKGSGFGYEFVVEVNA